MRKVTKEEKYRVFNKSDLPELKEINLRLRKSKYRQKFHIQPITGLLNDPNGFCFFKDKWHLFYQWFPFGAIHGAKNWYYMTSSDLVNWENKGLALKPDTIFDNRGVYSGSALVYNNQLNLFYTGNHKDENDIRHPYQCVAVLDENRNFTKKSKPIISMSDDYTEHQRDPKIIYENGKYYIILGAQNKDLKGRALIYSSKDPYSDWTLLGELKVKGYEDFGYMWECPDLIKLGDEYIFIFSPQGIEKDGYKYNNIYQNGYIIGSMNFDKLEFTPKSDFEELDRGFDFYASQSAYQDKFKNTAILASWMGLPDSSYTTEEKEDWSGCFSLIRELRIQENKLIQKPTDSIKNLRENLILSQKTRFITQNNISQTEILLENINSCDLQINIFSKEENLLKTGFKINFDSKKEEFIIDRENLKNQFNENQGFTRTINLKSLNNLNIFVDSSSIEIFINDGQYTMSSRVFPNDSENNMCIQSSDDIDINVWKLKTSISEEFVI